MTINPLKIEVRTCKNTTIKLNWLNLQHLNSLRLDYPTALFVWVTSLSFAENEVSGNLR